MLNYIWAFMIVISVVYGILTGRMEQLSNGVIEASKEAVTMCITMLGIMSMWMGFMEVARKSGLIKKCEKALRPVVHWLFPNVSDNHPAMQYITTNIIANILGLGWAATPAGLKAMEELSKNGIEQVGYEVKIVGDFEEDNKNTKRKIIDCKIKKDKNKKCTFPGHIATDEMCTFLVLNISSLQLIPVNIIAYRSQYGASNPAAVVVPAIIATSVSTGIGVLWCKIKQGK